jgi:RecJ-like exonuclease
MPLATERLIRLNGEVIDVEVTATPVVYSGTQAVRVTITDVTERVQARAALTERGLLAEFAAEVGRCRDVHPY